MSGNKNQSYFLGTAGNNNNLSWGCAEVISEFLNHGETNNLNPVKVADAEKLSDP